MNLTTNLKFPNESHLVSCAQGGAEWLDNVSAGASLTSNNKELLRSSANAGVYYNSYPAGWRNFAFKSDTPVIWPSKFRKFLQNSERFLVREFVGPIFRGLDFDVSLYVSHDWKCVPESWFIITVSFYVKLRWKISDTGTIERDSSQILYQLQFWKIWWELEKIYLIIFGTRWMAKTTTRT